MTDDGLKKLIALTLMTDIGAASVKKLLDRFGTPERAFEATAEELGRIPRLPRGLAAALRQPRWLDDAEREIEKAAKAGVGIVTVFDADYPELLKAIPDPPAVLYVKGRLSLRGERTVAIVGSRQASLYGLKMARSIAAELSRAGVVVISGLAKGIDAAAHEGALSAGGRTIGVLGGGLNAFYPPENRAMAEKMAERGAVISEYPMDMPPLPEYFPVRNRIVSGLSRGVLVVEARDKSGALITVDAALEQGRDVWAVPGNADSVRSEGTHKILKQGAKLVTSAADILEELGVRIAVTAPKPTPLAATPDEQALLSIIEGGAVHADQILEAGALPAGKGLALLQTLVLKGALTELPGKYYRRS